MSFVRHVFGPDEFFLVDAEGRALVYVPLRGVVLEVNDVGRRALLPDGDPQQRESLLGAIASSVQSRPLHRLGKDQPRAREFRPYSVGLCLTDRCQLACRYCHADSGPGGSTTLARDACEAALRFASKNAHELDKCLEVSFPGTGEPTQAWDTMNHLVALVEDLTRDHPPGHKISMSTNGVFSRSRAEYIADHFTGVSLSMDGPADIHDAQRPAANGRGTFEDVFATASYFAGREFLFSIRATVTEIGVDRLSEVWDFFERHFPGVPVGFERMNPIGRGHASSLRPPSAERFDAAFERLFAEAGRHSGLLVNSGVGKLNLLQSAFCKSLSFPCMTITPSGAVSACTRDGAPDLFHYGQWNAETRAFDIDMDKVTKFRELSVDSFAECADCFAKYHCAGDCYDLRNAGVRRCSTNRRMIALDLVNKLDHNRSVTSVSQADPRFRMISQKLHHR